MSSWDAGYISDIEYVPGFYKQQAPVYLNFACLLNGYEPVALERGFTYCELGCGQGLTAIMLAAANPQGEFHAMDFNPAHIVRANDHVAETGLSNITFHERGFDDFAEGRVEDLPQFDFITMHGVYSWINDENKQAIVKFLSRYLKPGGVVYVSYNSMPDTTAGLPLQRMFSEFARLMPGRSDLQVERALKFATELRDSGSPFFADNKRLDYLIKTWEGEGGHYLAHEYLNAHWTPLYHADVARDLAPAKLSFVATTILLENFPDLSLKPEQREVLDKIQIPEIRETFKDYFISRTLRQDVFVRGARRMSRKRQAQLFTELSLASVIPRQDASTKILSPRGHIEVAADVYNEVFDALAQSPLSMGEIMKLPSIRNHPDSTMQEIAGILIGSNQAQPMCSSARGTEANSLRAFNHAMLKQSRTDNSQLSGALASQRLGSAVPVTSLEAFTYWGFCEGLSDDMDAFASVVWQTYEDRGERMLKGGKAIEGRENNLQHVSEKLQEVLTLKKPIWEALGML
ncbi:class I SAM-dependent methyltransferase [Pelagibius sp. Alg239-R121]|uniref:class I SAM-dependent methyltransferase n=1 Tax=Pelagibius sp. Alg239-R121 TaxID=2993448 RepID=UPI0024A76CB0|nr:class I SAM-dependent methyltransferase [Pelagibius sp. Alg239-R121]